MGYDLTIDTTARFDDPANPGGVCTAEKGFNVPGGCALFRIHGIGATGDVIEGHQGNGIFALKNVAGINIRGMVANAEGCVGESVDSRASLLRRIQMHYRDLCSTSRSFGPRCEMIWSNDFICCKGH